MDSFKPSDAASALCFFFGGEGNETADVKRRTDKLCADMKQIMCTASGNGRGGVLSRSFKPTRKASDNSAAGWVSTRGCSFHGAEHGISSSYSNFMAEPCSQYTCLFQVGSRDPWQIGAAVGRRDEGEI